MHYDAVISKQFPMADESLRIIIKDNESFDTFKESVFNALKVTDARASNHMRWLLEDTTLTSELDYKELASIKEAVKLLFPDEGIPTKLGLHGESYLEFSKIMANGEDLKLYLRDVDSYGELAIALKQIWDILDTRLKRTNDRVEKFKAFDKSLDFTTRSKLATIMSLLYGKELPEVARVLKEIKESNEEEASSTAEEVSNA